MWYSVIQFNSIQFNNILGVFFCLAYLAGLLCRRKEGGEGIMGGGEGRLSPLRLIKRTRGREIGGALKTLIPGSFCSPQPRPRPPSKPGLTFISRSGMTSMSSPISPPPPGRWQPGHAPPALHIPAFSTEGKEKVTDARRFRFRRRSRRALRVDA